VADLLRKVVGIYLRAPLRELERFVESPRLLDKLDTRVALSDGRAIDLGRCWDELGCLLDGGITAPESGPTVGDRPLWSSQRAMWSLVAPDRVAIIAADLAQLGREAFFSLYRVEEDETADAAPGERTGQFLDRAAFLWHKLQALRDHYRDAAQRGEAMLIRLGDRPYPAPPGTPDEGDSEGDAPDDD
jgi:hypothetical protein